MPKKSKIQTPEWITQGYDSPEAYAKSKGKSSSKKKVVNGKTFNIKVCPECESDDVGVIIGKEEGKGGGDWECRSCGHISRIFNEKELSEDEFLEYLDRKDEEEMKKGGEDNND